MASSAPPSAPPTDDVDAPAGDPATPAVSDRRRFDFLGRWWHDLRSQPLQVALLAAPVVIVLAMAWVRRWTTEDAFINYRIIDQLFAGNGPVFNAGVRVEASTSTAWLYLLAAERALLGWAIPVEWLGVLTGLVLTAIGFIGIIIGSVRLQRASGREGLLLPAGALVLAVIPPLWDFSTSGLENSMVFAWIGGCFAALTGRAVVAARADERPSPLHPWWLAVLIGLAPLIRPELVLVAVPFWVAFWMTSVRGWRARLWSLGAALAIPFAYQIFRMGYYASMVPNTALAKEGTATRVGHGWSYLIDFVQPYVLAVPLIALAVLAALTLRFGRDRRILVTAAAPAIGGAIYAAYVVIIGGDYMHGRMMLAPIFALLAPIAVVALPTTWSGLVNVTTAALVAVTVLWSTVVGVKVRAPNDGLALDRVTADERGFWVQQAGVPNPVTYKDYYRPGADEADVLRLADARRDVFYFHGFLPQPLNLQLPEGSGVWAQRWDMGIIPYTIGTDVNFTDIQGLVDPIGSRLELPPVREQRPGHEKLLIAEFAVAELGGQAEGPVGKAATHVMSCGQIARLQSGIRDRMTPGLFVQNIFSAPANTRMRIPGDIFEAEKVFCSTP